MNKQALLEWESWEWLIIKDLKSIERKIQEFYKGSVSIGVSLRVREEFVAKRLPELIKQVTEG